MRTIGWLTLLLLTAAGGWSARGWQHSTDKATPTSSEPNSAKVMKSRIEQSVKVRGIVKPAPNALLRIGFPMTKDVARRIRSMTIVEGDLVKSGDQLALLDHADLLATLKQLKADALVVEKRMQASRTLEPVEVNVAKAMRDQAKVQAVQTQRNYERVSKLWASKTVSQQEYETSFSDTEVANAKLENTEASLQQVKTRFQTDIATLEAQIEQAQAAIKSVEVQIDWSTIHSPIDGVVFAVHQRPGELTSNQPSSPVLTLLDPKQLQVHLYVDEADFGKVQLGQKVKLRVEAHAGESIQGNVVRLLPQPILQENVVYYLAVVEVDEAKRSLLRSEMTTLAHIQVGTEEPILWLPLAAVKSRSDGWYIRLITGDGSVERAIQIGARSEGRVEIRAGLAEGDEVLVDQ